LPGQVVAMPPACQRRKGRIARSDLTDRAARGGRALRRSGCGPALIFVIHLSAVRKPSPNFFLAVTLVLAAGLVAFVLWSSGRATDRATRLGFQDADAPMLMPGSGEADRRLDLLSAWDAAKIPVATRFGLPVGVPYQLSGRFGQPAGGEGSPLPGDLFTGIGGENTALGDPVFAVADGLVIYAGHPSDEWGNVVVLAHRTADGGRVQSLYAHLHRVGVKHGELVPLGAWVGTVGTADGHYAAHLHFQIHRGHGPAVPETPATLTPRQIDPSAFLAEVNAAPAGAVVPTPLRHALSPVDEPWTTLEIKGAERLSELSEPQE
jgi:murein DD-endopeptidase MepM/ murein hydrolase activator NlpD